MFPLVGLLPRSDEVWEKKKVVRLKIYQRMVCITESLGLADEEREVIDVSKRLAVGSFFGHTGFLDLKLVPSLRQTVKHRLSGICWLSLLYSLLWHVLKNLTKYVTFFGSPSLPR